MNAETKVKQGASAKADRAATPAEPSPAVSGKADIPSADNLRIWNALSKTDPKHTKSFSRAGGFKGTAIKPVWITQRLTELFGPCGAGWGFERPDFQLVPTASDTLVYCTATAWYMDGGRQYFVYGVGGDKVVAQRSNGPFCDDEAFKKAFTDALGNAFKFVGVGADVHMGLFEDSKYLAEVTAEFRPKTDETPPAKRVPLEGPYTSKTALWTAFKQFDRTLRSMSDLAEFEAFLQTEEVAELLDQCRRDAPALHSTGEGLPDEFVPALTLIKQMRDDLANADDNWRTNPVLAG